MLLSDWRGMVRGTIEKMWTMLGFEERGWSDRYDCAWGLFVDWALRLRCFYFRRLEVYISVPLVKVCLLPSRPQ